MALRPKDKAVDAPEALRLLGVLINLWTVQANRDATILDDRLADYVFFPVSHLLRDRDRYPMRVTESVIRLLRELIQHGWKAKASPQLYHQLLVFLSFTIGGVPGQSRQQEIPEETYVEGFRTLAALIRITTPAHLKDGEEGQAARALGHSVTVMMDALTELTISAIQMEAVQCIYEVYSTIKEISLLAQFFPGTVSALTKVLAPPRANQYQKRVLLKCLEVLKLVLIRVLGDLHVRTLLKQLENERANESKPAESKPNQKELTPAWLKATVGQVKIALSAVLKLRGHESEDVQSGLHKLCIALLDECHASLVDCQSILVETALMLEDEETTKSPLETGLKDLACVYPELGDSIKSALYNWITGLPRVMQSSDERVKQLAARSILRGSKMAAALQMDSSTLEDALGDSLRDSIVTLMKGSKQPKIVDDIGDVSDGLVLAKSGMELSAYSPILLESEAEKQTREEIASLISKIGSPTQQVKLAISMLGYVRDGEGVDRVASYWLAFQLLKAAYSQTSELDEMFDFSSFGETGYREEAFRELYDFSVSVLAAHSDSVEADWRLEAISLEVAAFAASRLKTDFRPELIDVLYPITTFLGSPVPQLRRHAIVTLNSVAASCGYSSVSDLIVDNADYMVNSISLRLNSFDITPASTKVLTMVIRLTGPRLIPYLDDVVQSIFAALDNYHGYPAFVESLFSVLVEVVMQGAKSNALLLENTKTIDHRKKPPLSLGVPGILESLQKRIERAERAKKEEEELHRERVPHPQEPWGKEKDKGKEEEANTAGELLDKLAKASQPKDDDAMDEDKEDEEESQDKTVATREEEKQPTPTYSILSRILSLTQHYLTAPTPTLRRSLLSLIKTASSALAPDEDSFLPLVHAVWPVVIPRLRDSEPYVVVAACDALAGLCRAAGDFMSTRFKSEWSGKQGLKAWIEDVKTAAMGTRMKEKNPGVKKGNVLSGVTRDIMIPTGNGNGDSEGKLVKSTPSGSLGKYSLASVQWDAVLNFLTALVGHVRLDDNMFDDILVLVVDVLPQRPELREALEAVNADAVWLAMYEKGLTPVLEVPTVPEELEGFAFAPLPLTGAQRKGEVKIGSLSRQ